jgi:acetyl-CoA carboxylase biotin carboxyl carrier protein
VNWDETLERVRSAAEFCAAAGLARFRIDEDDLAVEIRRSSRTLRRSAAPASEAAATVAAGVATNGATPQTKPSVVVKSDLVGVVRLSRPTVTEGAVLTEDRELAYVEALGIRNPVRAGGPGRVTQVFVVDGQPVDYGQPLFAIEK